MTINLEYNGTTPAGQITAVLSRMYERGLTSSTGGNISVRSRDGIIWITPSATDKGNMDPTDIVSIMPDGSVQGKYKPSVENKFHRGIYEVRPDINAIIHAHSVGLITFSCSTNFPYTDLIEGSALKGVSHARVPCDLPGSDRLTENVTAKFHESFNTVLIDNHGAIIGADCIYRALLILEELKLSANIHLNAMTLIRGNSDGLIT